MSLVWQFRVNAESGQAFSISPPLLELSANPGQTITTSIKLTNISASSLVIQAEANDFAAKDETGDPKIIFDTSKSDTSSLHNWITLPASFILASKESKTINFPILIPKTAEPGGHYAVIRFTGSAPNTEDSVRLSASIGSLVLLKVSGDTQQKASIADFYSATPNLSNSSFFELGPISFVERIKNEGNVHIKPTGTLRITDMFGRQTANIAINSSSGTTKSSGSILPQSIRRFEEALPDTWLFGRYTATMHLTYGQPAQALSETITFWVIPYKLIAAGLIGLITLFFVLGWAIKRYNNYIVRKSRLFRK